MDGQEIFKENELAREVKESMYGTYYLGKVKPPWKYRSTVPYPQFWYIKSSENKVFGKIYFMVTFDLTDVRLFSQFISLGINSICFPEILLCLISGCYPRHQEGLGERTVYVIRT